MECVGVVSNNIIKGRGKQIPCPLLAHTAWIPSISALSRASTSHVFLTNLAGFLVHRQTPILLQMLR